MCGITGLMNLQCPIDPIELDRFTDAIAHRGPDGRGTWIDQNVGMGHRRLAILDLSPAGMNPMPYGGTDRQRYWITYNGEVYNFLELRQELEQLGHRFRSQTDTEIVVAAYAQWGEACLLKFNGMWAFAIWDTVEQQWFLGRDRFGVKPLYYLTDGQRFAFASEIKAFLKLNHFTPCLNTAIVPQLLQNSQAYEGLTDETLMQHVYRLPAGHCLTVKADGSRRLQKWWETSDHLPDVPSLYPDQIAKFQGLFLDAVKLRMRSDVAIGACLSGGIDSSAVLSAMSWHQAGMPARETSDWRHAFIATFPGTKLDEQIYADQVVQHVSAAPHYWVYDDQTALDHLLDTVWTMEDIYPGIAVPVWCLYRMMRQNGIVVSLDGHGGDELLGGYTWYLDWPMNQVNQNLYRDFHTTLLPSILRNYDRCSMAHGIEVRMPLMDWRLVTFAFALSAEAKMGGGYTKRIFRDAMAGIMPEPIRVRRSKVGFNSPMIDWYNGGMGNLLRRVVNHPLWLESPFWNGNQRRDHVLAKTNAATWTMADWADSLQVWTMVNLVLWQLMFIERDVAAIR